MLYITFPPPRCEVWVVGWWWPGTRSGSHLLIDPQPHLGPHIPAWPLWGCLWHWFPWLVLLCLPHLGAVGPHPMMSLPCQTCHHMQLPAHLPHWATWSHRTLTHSAQRDFSTNTKFQWSSAWDHPPKHKKQRSMPDRWSVLSSFKTYRQSPHPLITTYFFRFRYS